MENSYKFFNNRECKYFPCHKLADDSKFNCLFCFCPLYTLGENCGGNFTYSKNGYKSCENCVLPHNGEKSYEHVMAKMMDVCNMVKKDQKEITKTRNSGERKC